MPHAIDIYIDEDRILAACDDYDKVLLHGGPDDANAVIRYGAKAVVKYGCDVTAQEARNQRHAHSVLDPQVVRVPEVYYYFEQDHERERWGYLVMEYIEGRKCDDLPADEELQAIAGVVNHLASHHLDEVGPVGGGEFYCILLDCNDAPELQSIEDLEKYFNQRIFDAHGGFWDSKRWEGEHVEPLRFPKEELVLVHNHVTPSEILWCPDGTPALLDWQYAGFYPKAFEHASMRSLYEGGRFISYIDAMVKQLALNETDELDVEKVEHACDNVVRFGLNFPEDLLRPPPHWGFQD